ncbi:hypothetical protein GWD52_20015 [Enterobacteriaceae bacterium 4M9]|nr:hypothetical protein [Enterobacteriaceae bacterium 4M9]
MNFDKVKKRFAPAKKKDQVLFLSANKKRVNVLEEALRVYGIGLEYHASTPEDIMDIVEDYGSTPTRLWFVIDGPSYSDSDVEEFSMILRGRYPSVLLGTDNSLDASWHAEELGYTAYFIDNGDLSRLTRIILKGFGYVRSRTSMIIAVCNTSPDINLSYRTFSDLKKNEILKSYSTLFINCDLANIYYDAELGVRANKQAIQHITRDGEELDSLSSRKLINTFDDHFDYISFNLLIDDISMNDTDSLIKGIDNFIDSVSDIYGIIFINVPYYLMTSSAGVALLDNSDIRVLLTNGQIESIYNLNFMKDKIAFKQESSGKSKDKLFCLRQPLVQAGLRITDKDIYSKLGVKVDYSITLDKAESFFDKFKKNNNSNIIDAIFR